jgi:hypothetical protein
MSPTKHRYRSRPPDLPADTDLNGATALLAGRPLRPDAGLLKRAAGVGTLKLAPLYVDEHPGGAEPGRRRIRAPGPMA